MKYSKQKSVAVLALVLLLIFSVVVNAQKITVAGRVTNEKKQPILNAVVTNLSNQQFVTVSGSNGSYSIDAKVNDSLLFTAPDYLPFTVKVTAKRINVSLLPSESNMSDVVVVGYGAQRKADVTVSIEKVNMQDVNKAPVRSFDEALAGRVAGVQVTSSDGQPGAGTSIVVRGSNSITQDNSPLYIIDGFPIENPNNNVINPNDIESMEILKDASATAIYGSRGSNGVILITTKKGKEGPPVLNFNTSYASQKVLKTMKLMSPYEFVKYQIERDTSSTSITSPTYIYLTSPGRTLDYYKNSVEAVDWQDRILRVAPMYNVDFSLSGGSKNTKYLVSGSIVDQAGIIVGSAYKRYQGRVSLDQAVTPRLTVGLNTNYSLLQQSGFTISQTNSSATANVMYAVWGYRPFATSNDGTTNLLDDLLDPDVNFTVDYRINPYLNLVNTLNNRTSKNLVANSYAEYKFSDDLKLRASANMNSNLYLAERFNNSNTQYGNPVTQSSGVNGSFNYIDRLTWGQENVLTYNKRFNNKHNLTLVGVTSLQGATSKNYSASAIRIEQEGLGMSSLGTGVPQAINGGASIWSLASFAGRINYNYMYKYYFTGSMRADGSSRFAPGNRWGYFPAASFAWRFSQEPFFKKIGALSDGKLRLSYGVNGNNRLDDFAYMARMGMSIGVSYPINNVIYRGIVPTSLSNKDLRWETTHERNIGLDLGFFRNAITFTAELYSRRTNDLILRADLPTSYGYSSAFKNIGSVRNDGLELSITTKNISTEDFSWNTSFNISFNKNKVLSLAENQEAIMQSISWERSWRSVPAYMAKIGSPLGQIVGFIWDGVYKESDFYTNSQGKLVLKDDVTTNGNARESIRPGDIKYRDLNGDGVVNTNDYTVIGNGVPVHIGGFSNNFTYKGFDLNLFFQWSYGNDILNVNKLVLSGNALDKVMLNQFASYNDRWTPENPNSNMFRADKGFVGGGYSSMVIEDGSFLRFKTAALGYTLPANTVKFVKSLRVYVAAQNLYTWTKYSGMDPEVDAISSPLTPGFDWSTYPRARTVTIGLNLSL